MKNIKILAGILLILTAFTSCDNEPIDGAINLDDFDNPSTAPAVFKADFSGETWNGTAAQAVISGSLISIGATKADGSTFSILVGAASVGTYPANTNIIAYTPSGSDFGYWSVNLANESENTGSITITNIDTVNHKISGTFAYKGYWSDATTTSILPVQFTNGVFTNIPYQDNTSAAYYVKATQDGTAKTWNTSITASYVLPAPDARSLDIIGLSATSSMNLHIANDTGAAITTGVYPLVWTNVGCDYGEGTIFFSSDYADFTTSPGNITITEFDTTNQTIKGTFNFTGKTDPVTTSKVFTNGQFFVHYTN